MYFFITGLWDEGYALSPHIVKSVYVGEDPFGTKSFDTERFEIDQLLYEHIKKIYFVALTRTKR